MTKYALPKDESGAVNLGKVLNDVRFAKREDFVEKLLTAITANAKADERKRCEDACWAEHKRSGDGTDGAYRLERAILEIRNMGDEQ